MEPFLLFAVAAGAVIALGVHNSRRRGARAREVFTPLASEVGVSRIRTKPTRVIHTKGEVREGGTGLPERWHVQSTHPARVRSLLDDEVRGILAEVEEHRRVAVEVRDGRISILWGQPLDVAAGRRLLRLGRALRESLERQGGPGAASRSDPSG